MFFGKHFHKAFFESYEKPFSKTRIGKTFFIIIKKFEKKIMLLGMDL